jgi:cytochrome c-type biogenesis protein CcmE
MILSEKKLIISCVVFSVVGLIVLFVIAAVTEPAEISISDINNGEFRNNDKVRLKGFVESVRIFENNARIQIGAIKSVEAVSFDVGYVEELGLDRFQEVEVHGELRQYKGEPSLVIDKLVLVRG